VSVKKSAAKKPVPEAKASASATMEIGAALTDPSIFEPWFHGASWDGWRAVLRGAFGEQMTGRERQFFRSVANREPPSGRVKELWVVAGRRAGKDSVASLIAAFMAADFRSNGRLRPGERALVACLAVDRNQAQTVLGYIRGYFEQVPELRALVQRETTTGFELTNGVDISIITTDFRAVRGRTILCCVLDEISYWTNLTSSIAADREVYRSLHPAMRTLSESMLIGITTAYRRTGLAYERWHRHFGKESAKVLVIHAPSRALNPLLSQADIDEALAEDPEAARADYLSLWREDIAAAFARELVEAAQDGVTVRPPDARHVYFAFIDTSSGTRDSFACGIAHKEGDVVLLDSSVEVQAPFNTETATAQVAEVLKNYGCRSVMADDHARGWLRDELARHGITLEPRPQGMAGSDFHLEVLPLFSAGRVRLIRNARLVQQYCSLERRVRSNGREWIGDPRKDAHDDLTSACSGALWRASRSVGGGLWRSNFLIEPTAPLSKPAALVCSLIASGRGELGVAYFQVLFAPGKNGHQVLRLIDVDLKPLTPQSLRDIQERRRELARGMQIWDASQDRIFAQGVIAEELDRVLGGQIGAEAIDGLLGSDLALTSALHVAAEEVKVSDVVLQKPLGLGFLDGGPGRDDDVLRLAFLVGVVASYHGVPLGPRSVSPNANLKNN
jgi:hypothetical protein